MMLTWTASALRHHAATMPSSTAKAAAHKCLQGCYMGDRCNFAHIPQPDTGQARHTSGLKRQAADAGSGDIWRGGSFKRGRV